VAGEQATAAQAAAANAEAELLAAAAMKARVASQQAAAEVDALAAAVEAAAVKARGEAAVAAVAAEEQLAAIAKISADAVDISRDTEIQGAIVAAAVVPGEEDSDELVQAQANTLTAHMSSKNEADLNGMGNVGLLDSVVNETYSALETEYAQVKDTLTEEERGSVIAELSELQAQLNMEPDDVGGSIDNLDETATEVPVDPFKEIMAGAASNGSNVVIDETSQQSEPGPGPGPGSGLTTVPLLFGCVWRRYEDVATEQKLWFELLDSPPELVLSTCPPEDPSTGRRHQIRPGGPSEICPLAALDVEWADECSFRVVIHPRDWFQAHHSTHAPPHGWKFQLRAETAAEADEWHQAAHLLTPAVDSKPQPSVSPTPIEATIGAPVLSGYVWRRHEDAAQEHKVWFELRNSAELALSPGPPGESPSPRSHDLLPLAALDVDWADECSFRVVIHPRDWFQAHHSTHAPPHGWKFQLRAETAAEADEWLQVAHQCLAGHDLPYNERAVKI
jgi:hypothetical protein